MKPEEVRALRLARRWERQNRDHRHERRQAIVELLDAGDDPDVMQTEVFWRRVWDAATTPKEAR